MLAQLIISRLLSAVVQAASHVSPEAGNCFPTLLAESASCTPDPSFRFSYMVCFFAMMVWCSAAITLVRGIGNVRQHGNEWKVTGAEHP